MLARFFKSLLFGLLVSLPLLLLVFPFWNYADAYPYTLIVSPIFTFLILVPFCCVILLRLALTVSAWSVTWGQTVKMLPVFGLMGGMFYFLAQFDLEIMRLSVFHQMLLGWVSIIVWASLVTTVYGHYVVYRTLN